ncbi:AraC family transcriptional regulator [Ligilactobacillus sp. WILCCON 0076]|uniref:AraC family transcriptional regulator n=1 Tax=Ligilactobacillus ubinensis TaxID=2876789 RepID=A0A9X2JM18_9LACO|nr:AraC family transcriptional regulator [Ligilactobacillus ubinensis]MCP0887459.1 AraC family transcriptional regulator [Ligilactobacillus ubinensis]
MNAEYTHEIVKTTGPLSVWIYLHNVPGRVYVAPHWHQGIELSYSVHGTIEDFTISGHCYKTKENQILVVNSQEIHSANNYLTVGSEFLSIIYPYAYVASLYPEITKKEIQLNNLASFSGLQKERYIELQALLLQVVGVFKNESSYQNIRLQTLFDEVLYLMLRYFTYTSTGKTLYGQKAYVIERLQIITKFVNENFQENISLQEIAEKSNVSKEYLARFFKKNMGITVGRYINNVRAQNGYADILGHQKNLTDIAQLNGFSSIKTMNNAMFKLYGTTASQLYKKINI